MDMLFSARRVAGEEAYQIGLADRLTSKESLMIEAEDFAATITSSAPMAVESIRATLRGNLAEEVEKIVDWELSEQVRLQKTEDFKAGIEASLNREVPKFYRK
jgi:enoyl-CoA hydratase/carnithine racemase